MCRDFFIFKLEMTTCRVRQYSWKKPFHPCRWTFFSWSKLWLECTSRRVGKLGGWRKSCFCSSAWREIWYSEGKRWYFLSSKTLSLPLPFLKVTWRVMIKVISYQGYTGKSSMTVFAVYTEKDNIECYWEERNHLAPC